MPVPLFEKLEYVIAQYLAEMENDYYFTAVSEGAMLEQGKLNFVRSYLSGCWFMELRLMNEIELPHSSDEVGVATVAS